MTRFILLFSSARGPSSGRIKIFYGLYPSLKMLHSNSLPYFYGICLITAFAELKWFSYKNDMEGMCSTVPISFLTFPMFVFVL